jgi:prevent-host-death family protein
MKSFSLSELNRAPGQIVDAALAAPVELTKHGKPKLVVMPYEIYTQLNVTKSYILESAPDDVHNDLMEAINALLDDKA